MITTKPNRLSTLFSNHNLMSILLSILFFACSCTSDQPSTAQKNISALPLDIQVFKMIDKDGIRVQGPKSFHEQYIYTDAGEKEAHLILDDNGVIKAKEIYVYEEGKLVGSNYTTPDDSLLSYHVVLLDSIDNVSVKKFFDGDTKELLRVETYDYLNGDKLKIKKIHDSKMNLSRVFTFQHDEFGNEKGFKVYDPTGIPLFGEDYKITKMDDKNRWIEKTGYRNDVATTLKKRVLKK